VPALIALATLAGIWAPEFLDYRVSSSLVSAELVERARDLPSDAELGSLTNLFFFQVPHRDDGRKIAAARDVLRGRVHSTLTEPFDAQFPFDERDLVNGSSTNQLHRAMMMPTSILLDAYAVTQDPQYLTAARDTVTAWATFEAKALMSRGLLWNDHAIAERVIAVGRFWAAYRRSSLYDPAVGARVLTFARRSADLLAKPSHFTARSNHGVMQNVALLYAARVFPTLPRSDEYRRIALDRVERQLDFYISDEGMVLEHSPYYHGLGVRLLQDLRTLAWQEQSSSGMRFEDKLNRAGALFAAMQRADSSLPMIGNTGEAKDAVMPQIVPDPSMSYVLPASGLAVLWSRAPNTPPTQLVLTWSNFATRTHKHADDASLVLWSGQDIVTSSGYWPYDDPRLKDATGWRGSNAPHFVDESPSADRKTDLLTYVHDERLAFFDMQSAPRAGGEIRRQVVWLKPAVLAVLDIGTNSRGDARLETLWNTHYRLATSTAPTQPITIFGEARTQLACFAADGQLALRRLRASDAPFAGYISKSANDTSMSPSDAFELQASVGSPLLSSWTLATATPCEKTSARMTQWRDPEHWTLDLAAGDARTVVRREGAELSIASPETEATMRALPPLDVNAQRSVRASIDGAFRTLVAEYPPSRYLRPWRAKASWVVLGALGGQFIVFGLLARLGRQRQPIARLATRLAWPAIVGWFGGGSWLVFGYLG
jgi:hypothetical protein